VSDSQPVYTKGWYRQQQAEQAEQARARRELTESKVRAILAMEDVLTARCLLNQLIALDPFKALELLTAGGYVDPEPD
jgi:hypothetical protein